MKKNLYALAIIILHPCMQINPAWAEPAHNLLDETSRFSWDNDFYFFRDAQISNIFSYQKHLQAHLATDEEHMTQRSSWGFQQTMQTPQKSTPSSQKDKDVPFVGTFIVQKSWYAFNDAQLQGYAVSGGVVGKLSLAQETQALVHSLRGVQVYSGWAQQFPNEVVVNLHALKQVKIRQAAPDKDPAAKHDVSDGFTWDVAIGGNIALGNLISQVSSDMTLRFGYNMPSGFAYLPNTLGYTMHYLANAAPAWTHRPSIYASLALRASAIGYNLYWDGSLFQSAPKTSKNNVVGLLMAGIHVETANHGIHFTVLASSQNINTTQASKAIGNERIGALTYDWRY